MAQKNESMMRDVEDSLSAELSDLHDRILNQFPKVVRVSCVTHDPTTDMLRTFLHSTRKGSPLNAYEFPLSESHSLTKIVNERQSRYVSDIKKSIPPDRRHSNWLLTQGYKSSFTVPVFFGERFLGFVFYNSCEIDDFDPELRNRLEYYAKLSFSYLEEVETPLRIAISVFLRRDFETGEHLKRVAAYSELIARKMAQEGYVSDEFVRLIFVAAPLHDIGKISIPEKILHKPEPLTDEEYALIKTHVIEGVEILNEILANIPNLPISVKMILLNVISQHHEKLDGTGYPHGLKGSEISLEGRILGVVDIFDALTARRPYKDPWSTTKALKYLQKLAQRNQLDAQIVDILMSCSEEISAIMQLYPEKSPDRYITHDMH